MKKGGNPADIIGLVGPACVVVGRGIIAILSIPPTAAVPFI